MGKKQQRYDVLWIHEFSDRGQTMSSTPVLQTPVPRACRGKCAQEQRLNVVFTTGLLWVLCSGLKLGRGCVCVDKPKMVRAWAWTVSHIHSYCVHSITDTVQLAFFQAMHHHGLHMVNPLPALVWAGEDSALRNTWICPISSQPLKPDWQSPKSDHLLAPLDLPSSWLVMPLLRPAVNYLPEGSS